MYRAKLTFLMLAGTIGIFALVVSGYQLIEFMNSTPFCGQLCHQVMYPEYKAFTASPHTRVTCPQCHVGSGAGYLVKSRVSGVPLVFATLFDTYDRPIETPVENLRPARDTCERCHWPQKFSGDIVRARYTYLENEGNTRLTDTKAFRVGGGFQGARGIHWHVSAKVWYVPLDQKRQEIAWVGVEGDSGNLKQQFIDPQKSNVVDQNLIQNEKRLMDCIDCHNRITHIFRSPEDLIDSALTAGRIDENLPFIKREGNKALTPSNPSVEAAKAKLDAIREFYRLSYPGVYRDKLPQVDKAIAELKIIAELTTFPEMKVNWTTHLNNAGHIKSQGCFRCHGKLVETAGAAGGRAIDANCELCHYPVSTR